METQEQAIKILENCRIFQGMSPEDRKQILMNAASRIQKYPKGSYIFQQEDSPQKLYILLNGSVEIAKETMSGKRILIAQVRQPGEMFGEVYLFVEKEQYDMYAKVQENSVVLELSGNLFSDFSDQREKYGVLDHTLQYNLLRIFAEKAYQLNRKLRVLGSGSLREKIVRFLSERQDVEGNIYGNFTREQMADYMNVARPSVSRELGNMQEEGILRIKGKHIMILDRERFESYL